MKFGVKSIVRGLVSGAIVDLLVSLPAAWWDWHKAGEAMSRSGVEPDAGMFLELLAGWFGPIFLLMAPLCILFFAWRPGRKKT